MMFVEWLAGAGVLMLDGCMCSHVGRAVGAGVLMSVVQATAWPICMLCLMLLCRRRRAMPTAGSHPCWWVTPVCYA